MLIDLTVPFGKRMPRLCSFCSVSPRTRHLLVHMGSRTCGVVVICPRYSVPFHRNAVCADELSVWSGCPCRRPLERVDVYSKNVLELLCRRCSCSATRIIFTGIPALLYLSIACNELELCVAVDCAALVVDRYPSGGLPCHPFHSGSRHNQHAT